MKSSNPHDYIDARNLHDQLVQPITYLNAAIELWEEGLQKPDDVGRMKEEIEKLVEVVRDLQAQLRQQKVSLVGAA